MRLQAATTATTLAAGRIGGGGGDVLQAAKAQARAGKRADRRLSAGAGGLGALATRGAELDVNGGDATLLALLGNLLSSHHSSVGRSLIAIRLHHHAAGDTANGLLARQIGDVQEGVVERRKDVRDAEDVLALADDGEVRRNLLGRRRLRNLLLAHCEVRE
eukprot:Amastigsp_a339830_623.p2 type:complete len:161 gc:universal Amastigsp_a339830_623:498-16(-)